jgi:urocanate reductase
MRSVFQQEQQKVWAVFDENVRKMGGRLIGGFWTRVSDDLKKEIDDGTIASGETLSELGKNAGIAPGPLASTIEKWNQDASAGEDTVFNKKYGLAPISQAPFYAVRITERNLGSCGGIKINRDTRVVDVNGETIPRLYAGGMVTGGFIGPYYPGSGTAFAATVCFGRIAGKNAANETPWE